MKQASDVQSRPGRIEFADFRLDPKKRLITRLDGTPVILHSRAFDTLLVLASRQGQLVSKQELLEAVWPGVVVEENNLNQAISAVRKALAVDRDSTIKTIPGRGYCFVADTRLVEDAASDTAAEPDAPAMQSAIPLLRHWRKLALVLAMAAAVLIAVLLKQPGPVIRMPSATPPASALPVPLPEAVGPARSTSATSIAVLPFSNAGLDDTYTWFAQGLHDEVLTQLGRISQLNVISRNTMLQYRNTTKTPAEIANELNVATIVEGNIRAADDLLRITLQMTDPRTKVSLWSQTYDADISEVGQIFAIQTDIATNVARTLQAELLPQELELMSTVPTNSPAAYKLFLESYAALVPGDYAKALHLLEEAVAVDPQFIAAWTELSMLNTLMTGIPEVSPGIHRDQALAAAERALEINGDYAMAHVAMAAVKHNAGDWESAETEYELARSLAAPLDSFPMYSLYQLSLADFTGAKATLQRNLALDPINLISRGFLMIVHELLGDRSSSRAEYARGEAMYANWWGDNTGVWLALGRNDTAYLEKSLREFPSYSMREVMELYDDRDAAVERLQQISRSSGSYKPGPLMNAAMFAAYYDEQNLALDLLKAGLRDNWVSFYVLWLPVFDELRQSAEFKQFLADSGIIDFWRAHGWPQVCRPLGASDFECSWRAIPSTL